MEKEQSASLNIKVAIKDERTGETKRSRHGPYQRDDMPVQLTRERMFTSTCCMSSLTQPAEQRGCFGNRWLHDEADRSSSSTRGTTQNL